MSLVVKGLLFLPPSAVDKATNPVLQVDNVEVDQQSERFTAKLKVRNYLSLMNRRDCVDRLDLHDDEIFNQEINSVPDFKLYTSINDGKPDLTCSPNARFMQFVV